jgi:hypothetical protein
MWICALCAVTYAGNNQGQLHSSRRKRYESDAVNRDFWLCAAYCEDLVEVHSNVAAARVVAAALHRTKWVDEERSQ